MPFTKEAIPKWERLWRAGKLSDEAVERLKKTHLLEEVNKYQSPRSPEGHDYGKTFKAAPEEVQERVLAELSAETHRPTRGVHSYDTRGGGSAFVSDPLWERLREQSWARPGRPFRYATTDVVADKFMRSRGITGELPHSVLQNPGAVIGLTDLRTKKLPEAVREQILEEVGLGNIRPRTLQALGYADLVDPAFARREAVLEERTLDAALAAQRLSSSSSARTRTGSSRMAWDPTYKPWEEPVKEAGYLQVMKVAGLGEWLGAPFRLPGSALKHLDVGAFSEAVKHPSLRAWRPADFYTEPAREYARTMDPEILDWAKGIGLSMDDLMALGSRRVELDRLPGYKAPPPAGLRIGDLLPAARPELNLGLTLQDLADEARDAFRRDLKQTAGVGAGAAALGAGGMYAKKKYDEANDSPLQHLLG